MAYPRARALYHHDDLHRLINPERCRRRRRVGDARLVRRAHALQHGRVSPARSSRSIRSTRALLGRPCVPSLADMPESPDCVVLCVARPMVEGMIEAAAAVKAGGVIVYASGFAETAKPDRIEAQQRLVELAQRTGVRVVGPNCVGLANTRSGAGLNFMPGLRRHGPPARPDRHRLAKRRARLHRAAGHGARHRVLALSRGRKFL